ncbi:MAG: phosphoglycolate phosphatase, partial [Alphaproteobacteria bacterium]|nr:phosphoglycolate phosphatase [Alphaproteobacteria bacterium]
MPRPPARSFKAVVFDLDGTLVDSAPDIHAALNATLAQAGRAGVDLATATRFVGDGARKLVARGFAATGGEIDGAELDDHCRAFLDAYAADAVTLTRPYRGASQMLLALKAEGRMLGVCTNKPDALTMAVLTRLGLAPHFEAIVGPDRVARKKPDAEHLLTTLRAMGAAPAEAVMIGDSANDVTVARAAGATAIAVSFGFAQGDPAALGADALVHAL